MKLGGQGVLRGEWLTWYPEDLPAQWRADYYANEYPALLFSRGDWEAEGGMSEKDIAELEWSEYLEVFVEWDEKVLDSPNFVTFCNRVQAKALNVCAWVYVGEQDGRCLSEELCGGGRQMQAQGLGENGWCAEDTEGSVFMMELANAEDLRATREEFESAGVLAKDNVTLIVNANAAGLLRLQTMFELMGV